MRRTTVCVLLLLVIALSGSVLAAERKHGVGIGLVSSNVEPESATDLDFAGFTVFGKIGITENWGILVSYRDMEDDEDLLFGEEDEYTEIGVHGAYMWRPDNKVRPHVKFGFVRTELEVSVPGFLPADDDGTGFSVGGGLEAGSEKIAFFGDLDVAVVELFDEDFDFVNVTLGVIFKF
jgi:hypothetical protein